MKTSSKNFVKAILISFALPLSGPAVAASLYTLTTGMGDGSASVFVNEFGAIRSYTSSIYDPVGPMGPSDLYLDSEIQIGFQSTDWQNPYRFDLYPSEISSFDHYVTIQSVSQNPDHLRHEMSLGGWDYIVDQRLSQAFDANGQVAGAVLTQSYTLTNPVSENDFAYDPDTYNLRFILGINPIEGPEPYSFSGLRVVDDQIVMFTSPQPDPGHPLELSLTASGGSPGQTPFRAGVYPSYDVGFYGLLDSGLDIEGDFDGDGVNDFAGPDPRGVAMQRDFYDVAPGESVTVVSQIIFGAAPPFPDGQNELSPILPGEVIAAENGAQSFVFEFQDPPEGQIFWIDPEIAVGYVYEVTGAEFASVTAPSFALIGDTDGYTLSANGHDFHLASGTSFNFLTPSVLAMLGSVNRFTISGIDMDLMLDPENASAFAAGISFTGVQPGGVFVTQTPMTVNITPGAVPLPPAGLALLAGTGLLWGFRKRKPHHA
ncbi:MAG: hypothetical protein ACPGNV_07075 [Mangrovicoccus sp.]